MHWFFSALALALTAAPVLAESTAMTLPATGPVSVNVSYNLQLPAGPGPETAELLSGAERGARKSMYTLAAKECGDLLATIASSCQITAINVSTQINRYPGQVPTLYISSNVSLQIALK
jgi:hypothetical protein